MSQMDRRQALRFLAALGATGLVAACGSGADAEDSGQGVVSDEPIRIGMITPQSGGNKPIGDEIVKGFELFLSLNDRRLGGRPVELVTADEGATVESGKAALDSLLKQNVTALTGVVDSTIMLGISQAVEKAQVPLIGSNASLPALQSVVYIWRTSYVNSEPGQALGPYVAREIAKKAKVAIVAADYPVGRDAVRGFRESFGESDPRIADPVLWAPHTTDPGRNEYADQISAIRDRDPDAIYCMFAGAAAVTFIKQLRAAGYRGPNKKIYAPGFLTEGSVLEELGEQAAGIQTALNYSADLRNGANRRFATAWDVHGTTPTTYAVASYDAAQVLDKAIRLAGERSTPQQLNLALGKVGQIDSPRGGWQFNQTRTPQQSWYLREVRRDGQLLSNVLISELATLG